MLCLYNLQDNSKKKQKNEKLFFYIQVMMRSESGRGSRLKPKLLHNEMQEIWKIGERS